MIALLQKKGELDSLNALVIVDADTLVDQDLLRSFDRDLRSGHDWIQAYYTVANPDESWPSANDVCMSLYNGVMPLGKTRWASVDFQGKRDVLFGSWVQTRSLACHGLVEDMEYAWNLRIAGQRIKFQPDVSVDQAMPRPAEKPSAGRRWEFGRRQVQERTSVLCCDRASRNLEEVPQSAS